MKSKNPVRRLLQKSQREKDDDVLYQISDSKGAEMLSNSTYISMVQSTKVND